MFVACARLLALIAAGGVVRFLIAGQLVITLAGGGAKLSGARDIVSEAEQTVVEVAASSKEIAKRRLDDGDEQVDQLADELDEAAAEQQEDELAQGAVAAMSVAAPSSGKVRRLKREAFLARVRSRRAVAEAAAKSPTKQRVACS